MQPELINSRQGLRRVIAIIIDADRGLPNLFVDLEGTNLGRKGTIALVTILVANRSRVYLVDVTTLGSAAFTTEGSDGSTLKSILESREFIKVFFDVRNDSDALFGLFGVNVARVHDLQLMELPLHEPGYRGFLNGLAKCIGGHADLSWDESQVWRSVKDRGKKLFAPELGGSYAVFDERPLSKAIESYCVQDVTLMPKLYNRYAKHLCDHWWSKMESESSARIRSSHAPEYDGNDSNKRYGPQSWGFWTPPSNFTSPVRLRMRAAIPILSSPPPKPIRAVEPPVNSPPT